MLNLGEFEAPILPINLITGNYLQPLTKNINQINIKNEYADAGNPEGQVSGFVFDISHAELAQADVYEVEEYKWVDVQLRSGIKA